MLRIRSAALCSRGISWSLLHYLHKLTLIWPWRNTCIWVKNSSPREHEQLDHNLCIYIRIFRLENFKIDFHESWCSNKQSLDFNKNSVWRHPKYSQQLASWLMCSMASKDVERCTYERKPQRSSLNEKNIIMFMLHFNIRLHLELTCALHFIHTIAHHCSWRTVFSKQMQIEQLRSLHYESKCTHNLFRSVQTGRMPSS